MRRRSSLPFFLICLSLISFLVFGISFITPRIAENSFGPSSPELTSWQRVCFSVELLWNSSDLTIPYKSVGDEVLFIIEPGEDAFQISSRLEQAGLIKNAKIFRVFLAWTGMDAFLQAGTFRLSPSLSAESIAGILQSTALTEIYFSILPGWRIEEIAAALPTSGLPITPEEFVSTAYNPGFIPDLVTTVKSVEGYLFPDTYILPRVITPNQLISVFLQRFNSQVTEEIREAFYGHGLTLHEAVILASIVEREAVLETEMPMIASVFYNRLAVGMKLQTDPTIQYALGFNFLQGTWWTTPLSSSDFEIDSPYNTYLYPGIPPGPISNPGIEALLAIAFPAESTYYFFQAKCDGSGIHNFSETFEQHESYYCP